MRSRILSRTDGSLRAAGSDFRDLTCTILDAWDALDSARSDADTLFHLLLIAGYTIPREHFLSPMHQKKSSGQQLNFQGFCFDADSLDNAFRSLEHHLSTVIRRLDREGFQRLACYLRATCDAGLPLSQALLTGFRYTAECRPLTISTQTTATAELSAWLAAFQTDSITQEEFDEALRWIEIAIGWVRSERWFSVLFRICSHSTLKGFVCWIPIILEEASRDRASGHQLAFDLIASSTLLRLLAPEIMAELDRILQAHYVDAPHARCRR